MSRLIVFASTDRRWMKNRILDLDYLVQFRGASLYAELVAKGLRRGYTFTTADVFLESRYRQSALLISETGAYNWWPHRGLIPAVCFDLESPIVAWHFYSSLSWIGNRFKNVFLWPGALSRLNSNRVKSHPIYWPCDRRHPLNLTAWNQKQAVVMINGNKAAFSVDSSLLSWSRPSKSVIMLAHHGAGLVVNHIDPWMKSDFYIKRLNAIRFFSEHNGFHLFGRGWNFPIPGLEREMRQPVERSWRGCIAGGGDEKLTVLRNYKFCLCFENTGFPGYITEKIFDCFFAGCIPIYLGAPDVLNYIPCQSFIDARLYPNYHELMAFIMTMDLKQAEKFIEAARDFLNSTSFDRFQESYLAEKILDAVDQVQRDND